MSPQAAAAIVRPIGVDTTTKLDYNAPLSPAGNVPFSWQFRRDKGYVNSMNRLPSWTETSVSDADAMSSDPRDAETLAPPDSSSYCSFSPIHYEPNYAYPLIVWLHGPGGDPSELHRLMPWLSLRNYVAVAVGGTQRVDAWHAQPGYSWGQSSAQLDLAAQRVDQAIERAGNSFHIASHRVFLMGYDAGGTTAIRLALRGPSRFAGAVSIGGPFPQHHAPLATLPSARRLPLLILQGRDSQAYSTDQLCDDLRLLYSAGMQVAVRQYPCQQEVTTAMLADANAWLMERITGRPCQSESEAGNVLN